MTTRPPVDVSIITSGHDVADARLHREVSALHRAGLSVEVLGLGSPAGGPPEAQVLTWTRAGGLSRMVRALTMPWRAKGRVVMALDPDAAVGAWVRRLLTRRIALVADVHEDYTLVLRDRDWAAGPRALAARLVVRLSVAVYRRADALVVADDHLVPQLSDRVLLRNLPDRSMLPGPSQPEPSPRAIYIGDLRPSRGLLTMLDALAACPAWTLDLVGPMTPQVEETFRARLAADADLAARVRWHGRLAPRSAWALTEGSWVGLMLLEDTAAFRDAVPSKLYEYLASGLAVITTDLPRPAQLIRTAGAGAVVQDAASTAQVLNRLAADPAELATLRQAAVEAAADNFGSQDEYRDFVETISTLVRDRATTD